MKKFYLISLILHLLAFASIVFWPEISLPRTIKVRTIDPAMLAAIKKKNRGQMVRTKEIQKSDPVDTNYLGAQDQRVSKETMAPNNGAFQELKRKGGKGSKKITLSDLANVDVSGFRKRISESSKQREGQDKVDQRAQSMDDLENVQTGDQTLLSTRQFIYYSYYNRIHRKIEMLWPAILRDKLELANRQRYVSPKEVVQIVVLMNKKGNIEKVMVEEQSRIKELDDSAVEAFNRAGPFHNPPEGIADPDGYIRMRWGFVLYTGNLVKN